MEASAETTPAAEALPRRRRWLRIPTALIVTLIGIALTAWLLPAFTHQWDDRQKARQLQADLAQQISIASANVLGEILGLMDSDTGTTKDLDRIRTQWLIARYRIQARLETYFAPYTGEQQTGTSVQWDRHAELVDRMI